MKCLLWKRRQSPGFNPRRKSWTWRGRKTPVLPGERHGHPDQPRDQPTKLVSKGGGVEKTEANRACWLIVFASHEQ